MVPNFPTLNLQEMELISKWFTIHVPWVKKHVHEDLNPAPHEFCKAIYETIQTALAQYGA